MKQDKLNLITLDYLSVIDFAPFKNQVITKTFVEKNWSYLLYLLDNDICEIADRLREDVENLEEKNYEK